MNLWPLKDRVIVRPEHQAEHDTASGLYTVEDYAPSGIGTVMACADGLDVKADDVVIYPPSAGQAVEFQGEQLLALHVDEILATWEH